MFTRVHEGLACTEGHADPGMGNGDGTGMWWRRVVTGGGALAIVREGERGHKEGDGRSNVPRDKSLPTSGQGRD